MIDERMETLYRQVTLVKGAGNPRRAEFCVMSFVALLAGERHNDHPQAASPLIRQFAVIVNDALPRELRQRLKPFAPRILGTNDGMDPQRAAALLQFARGELLPRIEADLAALNAQALTWFTDVGRQRMMIIGFSATLQQLLQAPLEPRCFNARRDVATAIANLLCRSALAARDRAATTRYWAMALDMLDRLCDIREDAAAPAVAPERIAGTIERLAAGRKRGLVGRRMHRLFAPWGAGG
jgi:hypothetical protein